MIHLGQQPSVSSNSCAQTFWCTHPSQPFSSDLTSCSFYLDLLCCCLYVWTAILFSNAGFPQLLYFCNRPVCALIFRKPSSDEPWMLFHTSGKKKQVSLQTCLNEFFPSTFKKTHTEHCKLALIHHFEVSFSRALKLLWLIA